ncbi:hypothetical protein FXO38_07525 [Capsicum annuum]|nr:hypothetical protein FXO38_07525 [Capsicum annuum]
MSGALFVFFFMVFVRPISVDYGFILDIFARDAIAAAADFASGGAGPDSGLAVAKVRVDSPTGGDIVVHLGLAADEVHLVAPHADIDLSLPDIDLEVPHGFVGGRIRRATIGAMVELQYEILIAKLKRPARCTNLSLIRKGQATRVYFSLFDNEAIFLLDVGQRLWIHLTESETNFTPTFDNKANFLLDVGQRLRIRLTEFEMNSALAFAPMSRWDGFNDITVESEQHRQQQDSNMDQHLPKRNP